MSDEKPLTSYTRFSGCGAKLGPGVLDQALCGLSQPRDPRLLADFSHCEDAGLYALDDGQALVQTVDFFPPIVDDPYLFGRIAAANALSDVYAMGGRPATALALVCFPLRELGLEKLQSMMEGGLAALIEAGCSLLGGHSIEDAEPKLGYAVTGFVDARKAWRNNSLREGSALILTKPLGTGLVNMAVRAQMSSPEAQGAAESSMATLNRKACEVLSRHQVFACTDVTGFGLGGHAAEMASGPDCGLRVSFSALPFLPGAQEYAAMGLVPEGASRNRTGRGKALKLSAGKVGAVELDLFYDPQTSGGLLAAVPAKDASRILAELQAEKIQAALIGEAGGPAGTVELGD